MPFDYPEAGASVPASGSMKGEAVNLKPYKTTVNGYETTLMLSDADAKAQGLFKETDAKQAPKAANKARKASNKAKG